MIKEAKNIDFYTTGRQPTDQDFAKVSEWIKKDKQRNTKGKSKSSRTNSLKKIIQQEVLTTEAVENIAS